MNNATFACIVNAMRHLYTTHEISDITGIGEDTLRKITNNRRPVKPDYADALARAAYTTASELLPPFGVKVQGQYKYYHRPSTLTERVENKATELVQWAFIQSGRVMVVEYDDTEDCTNG